jgi:hypothetical protein
LITRAADNVLAAVTMTENTPLMLQRRVDAASARGITTPINKKNLVLIDEHGGCSRAMSIKPAPDT